MAASAPGNQSHPQSQEPPKGATAILRYAKLPSPLWGSEVVFPTYSWGLRRQATCLYPFGAGGPAFPQDQTLSLPDRGHPAADEEHGVADRDFSAPNPGHPEADADSLEPDRGRSCTAAARSG